ncbi:energy-coupling factor transporter transmembrane component T family protein [Lachnoclostridium sp. Marseille-P6806]|uniref:energy-coupling factor transporter transmembrane component T family protein n=1 Tax=Lachnoclostridium sp. Marseille-P6806 TaxID=2364793 RepID=UPI0010315BDD|nr:energy-coupling factor transporter transmembrane component T [Lachnoclostridium sp. Marseille-P6806]
MFREITLGQYYQTDSLLHRLDPRVKVAGVFFYIISLFLIDRFAGYLAAGAFLFAAVALSRVPFRYILNGMRPVLFLLSITVLFNLFLTPGEHVLWRFWRLQLTMEGGRFALKMAFRLIFLITASTLMTLTTTPNQMTDALEKLLRPLRRLHVPVHEIAMMMSIALRFIPILTEELDKIQKAQMARGADFESGGLLARVRAMVPLLVPLFIAAFRRANDLAMAMEARCYRGGEGRTRMKPLRYQRRDGVAYLVLILYFAAAAATRAVPF